MKILILGGTGAMGKPLVNILVEMGYEVYVTSRKEHNSDGKVNYLLGNAHNNVFIEKILLYRFDILIDFMIYTSIEFEKRIDLLLKSVNQYVFLSSARVYAESLTPITENSQRLLDVCIDEKYLISDEYALAKARQEDYLQKSEYKNWTIIRPYITYNNKRLQLGVYEKEHWLYRALNGRSIVFTKDIAQHFTSLTHGYDVAVGISQLIGKENAKGQIFHIASPQVLKWNDILEIYLDILEEICGVRPKVCMLNDSNELKNMWNSAQICYDRLYDRIFDSSKIDNVCGKIAYKDIRTGLKACLVEFISEDKCFQWIDWRFQAWADRKAGELAALNEIPGIKMKLKYLKWRYISL